MRQRVERAGIDSETYKDDVLIDEKREATKKARVACLGSGSANIHVISSESILDSRAKFQNYRGLYNLAFIVLVVTNLRLVVENILKYGLLLSIPTVTANDFLRSLPSIILLSVLPACPFIAHSIEVMAWRGVEKEYRRAVNHVDCSVVRALSGKPPHPILARAISARQATWLHVALISSTFFVPCLSVHFSNSSIAVGLVLVFLSLGLCMKLISYAHVMTSDRQRVLHPHKEKEQEKDKEKDKDKEGGEISPKSTSSNDSDSTSTTTTSSSSSSSSSSKSDKKKSPFTAKRRIPPAVSESDLVPLQGVVLDVRHLLYFIAAPTLCYQHSFPRYPPRIRKRFVVRRLIEMVFLVALMGFMSQQYIEPLCKNALRYFAQEKINYLGILERVLKLSIPNSTVWLLGFYLLFHSWLNFAAELLRFGDRVFYRDWWNAITLRDYWNRWNIPVHNWVLRHIYGPCLRAGYSEMVAQLVVFFVSAALHEVLVALPTHSIKGWAFMAMMFQVPLIMVTQFLVDTLPNSKQWGNVLFWVFFCIFGQPMLALLYYQDITLNQ